MTKMIFLMCLLVNSLQALRAQQYYGVGGGSAQAQTAQTTAIIPTLKAGVTVQWKATVNNTGALPSLAVGGLQAGNTYWQQGVISKCGTTALVAGDIAAGVVMLATFDGTKFQLNNPQVTGCANSGGGGAGTIATIGPGSVGGILVTGPTGPTTSLDADPTVLMFQGNNNAPRGNMIPSTGIWDLSSASSFTPPKFSSDPGTCAVGQVYFNTVSNALRKCTAANTWADVGGGGSVTSVADVTASLDCSVGAADVTLFNVPSTALTTGNMLKITVTYNADTAAGAIYTSLLFGSSTMSTSVQVRYNYAYFSGTLQMVGANQQEPFFVATRGDGVMITQGGVPLTETTGAGVPVKAHYDVCGAGGHVKIAWAIEKVSNGSL